MYNNYILFVYVDIWSLINLWGLWYLAPLSSKNEGQKINSKLLQLKLELLKVKIGVRENLCRGRA